MEKTTFLRTPLGSRSAERFVKGTFETCRCLPEPGIIATTDFRDNRLLNVPILFSLRNESEGNLSVERELTRKQKHGEWLHKSLGEHPYRYNWGEVTVDFHHQHCESDIMVVYES
jgi:hypothetical protein